MIKQKISAGKKHGRFMFLLALIIVACNNRLNKEKLLYSDNKLWLIENTKNVRDSTFYSFGKNGKWLVYKQRKGSKGFEKANFGDIQLIESWKFVNDSVINVGGMDYKIITLNDSCFKYSNLENKIFIKMCYKGDHL